MFLGRFVVISLLSYLVQCVALSPDAQQATNFFLQINGDPNSYINKFYRATMLCELHEYNFALRLYDELLQQNPNSNQIMYNKAYVLKMIGQFESALPLYRTVLANDPNNQQAHIGLYHCLLNLGQYEEGFKEIEWRLVRKEVRQHGPIDLNSLHNKTIFISCESGLGDQIQCIRYAKTLKDHGAYVIAQTYEVLIPLMKCCPYVDKVVPQGTSEKADFVFCYFSLPLVCNTTSEKTIPTPIPYFVINQPLIELWKKNVSQNHNFKIGLSWHSKIQDASFEFSPYRKRSIPLKKFIALSELSNISFYSLQRVTGLNELNDVNKSFPIIVFDSDFDDSHGRFMDTAALMLNLDLVITVDTAVAHLAGALGVRTWLILPATADWRWQQNRTDCPWYPCMRIFRQKHAGNWDEVIQEIKFEIKNLLRK